MEEKTILVVDDSDLDRQLIISSLSRKTKFKFLPARNGGECLVLLEQHKVDAVLMDIMMPGKDGSEILRKIREKTSAIELPIIMVTSKEEPSDIIHSLNSGANDYITKPLNFEIALSRIFTHLRLAELSCEASRLREMAALNAMITTYNHELNNPLTIALGYIDKSGSFDELAMEKLRTALWRIADIVKRIRAVSQQKNLEFDDYARSAKMIKIK